MSARGFILGAFAVVLVGMVGCGEKTSAAVETRSATAAAAPARAIPRLVDLGAGKCIPCKAMAPILEQLRADYSGRLEVTFIDVWQAPDQARAYDVRMIPTQIFYSAEGRELARHEGFMSREEILAQWRALGLEL
ncbi:co-chaperone YbbN [Anaeromyxobacter sp. PSR-1]|uniref:thioredoxin family protein n=1 Tax=Anaeromyxobacter sp. PSR-1 TaxID=1300915 RepID=UPI000750E782|nr:thioredoxin family protein [Anaeromyxobacter sp. PSR-1]